MCTLPRQFMAFCVSLRHTHVRVLLLLLLLFLLLFLLFLILMRRFCLLSSSLALTLGFTSPSFRLVPSIRRSLSVRLPKSRQHLASSILGEIQADILSRAITVTFDHRMTGEWLTLRHQSMNFSLSARYNLQSARWPSRRPSPDSLGLTRHTQPAVSFPFSFSYFFPLPLS